MPIMRMIGRWRAFTLIELLVVIAIIAILIGLLLACRPEGSRGRRPQTCSNNLKQIGVGLHNYHGVYNQFPGCLRACQAGYGTGDDVITSCCPIIEQDNIYNLGSMRANPNTNPAAGRLLGELRGHADPRRPTPSSRSCARRTPTNSPTPLRGPTAGSWGTTRTTTRCSGTPTGAGWANGDGGLTQSVAGITGRHSPDTIGYGERYAQRCTGNGGNGNGCLWAHGEWNPRWERRLRTRGPNRGPGAKFQVQPSPYPASDLARRSDATPAESAALRRHERPAHGRQHPLPDRRGSARPPGGTPARPPGAKSLGSATGSRPRTCRWRNVQGPRWALHASFIA